MTHHDYYGTKRVTAWPVSKDGEPGYRVKYQDGYVSWSPASTFEAAYQRVDGALSFGHAVVALEAGKRVARSGWNGRGMFLELQRPEEGSKMSLPYIYMSTASGELVPWLASQSDMLGADWFVVGEQ